MNRLVLGCVALFVAATGLLASPAVGGAAAAPTGSCTTTVGAIVAVDFSHWGGPTVRGCGVNSSSGYALLHDAGFATTGTSHDGPAFVCRIGNQAFAGGRQYPTATDDACVRTPPASAYWSYWIAPAGRSTWSYSSSGAMSHVPQPGEVEIWTFGGTDLGGTTGSGVPKFGPDAVRAHNTAPPGDTNPAPTPTTRGSGNVTTPTAAPPPGSGVGPQGNPSASDPTTVPGSVKPSSHGKVSPTTTPTGAKSPAQAGPSTTVAQSRASASSTVPRIVDALPAVHTESSSGSIVPLLVALALVVALGGGAASALWRRRQAE